MPAMLLAFLLAGLAATSPPPHGAREPVEVGTEAASVAVAARRPSVDGNESHGDESHGDEIQAAEIHAAVYAYRRAHALWDANGRRGPHPARAAYPVLEDLVARGWFAGRLWLLEHVEELSLAPSDLRRRRRALVEGLLAETPAPAAGAVERALLTIAERPAGFDREAIEPLVRAVLSRRSEAAVQAAGLVALGALLDAEPDPRPAADGDAGATSPQAARELWRGVLASHSDTAAAEVAADLLLQALDRVYREEASAWVRRWLASDGGGDPGPHPAAATWSEVETLAEAGSGRALWWLAREIGHLDFDADVEAARRLALLDRLIAEHADEPWLAEAVQFSEVVVTDLGREAVERLGQGLLESSRDPRVRAWVLHGMATIVAADDEDPAAHEKAIALLERLRAEYPSDRLAEAAGSWLFALRHLRPGLVPPPRTATAGDGGSVDLAALRGRVVLLVFWGYWSPPAGADLARLGELVEAYDGRPFELIGVNSDDDPEAARARFQGEGYDWRNVWEGRRSGPWTQSWHIRAFPTYFVLDADGRIVAIEEDLEAVEPRIAAALEAAASAGD